MRTSNIGSFVLAFVLCGFLLLPHAVSAQGTIFDIVAQTSKGLVPDPSTYGQYVLPQASGYASGTGASDWLRQVTGATSGWSYTASNGWQFATTDEAVRTAGGYVAERVQRAPVQDFAPGWMAFNGAAWWPTIYGASPIFGFVLYGPAFAKAWNKYPTSGVVN